MDPPDKIPPLLIVGGGLADPINLIPFSGATGQAKTINQDSAPSVRPAPASLALIGPGAAGTRDDFLREILREAAQARKDFNYFLHTALEAVRKLPD